MFLSLFVLSPSAESFHPGCLRVQCGCWSSCQQKHIPVSRIKEGEKGKKYTTACSSLKGLPQKFTVQLVLTSQWTSLATREERNCSHGVRHTEVQKKTRVLSYTERRASVQVKWLRVSATYTSPERKRLWRGSHTLSAWWGSGPKWEKWLPEHLLEALRLEQGDTLITKQKEIQEH